MKRNNILIVDDELLIRDLLYEFFNEREWDVTVSNSGESALLAFEEKDYDVVLTDLKMPEMDGSTMIDRMKESKPDQPIVVVTGYPSVESAIRALQQRVDDYVVKPFNMPKLFKSVEQASARKEK
ncbi:response regulator [bacterium AH-315-J21]|nr:response regulator [bacterium AH-315-J21]